MRFTLYGEAEGVLGLSEEPYFAVYTNQVITDASVSARKQGVVPGLQVSTAKALLPLLILEEEPDMPPPVVQSIWNELWNCSPWVETVGKNSFYLQIPGKRPPLREIRSLLLSIEQKLSVEQRARVAFAENPFLARALLEWSRVERVPEAVYYKVGRQQWLLSPSLAAWHQRDKEAECGTWIQKLPLAAFWILPRQTVAALAKLGIYRLHEWESIPREQRIRHFGKESLLWSRFLHQEPGGRIQVNYPPVHRQRVWQSALGEEISLDSFSDMLTDIAASMSADLQRAGSGALKVGLRWETDEASGGFEKVAKKPVCTVEAFQANLAPAMLECHGMCLKRLELYVEDIRPLQSVQSLFVLKNGAFVPTEEVEKRNLHRLLVQVNRKFPKGLQFGLHPSFRELRLQAVLEQAFHG